MGHIIRQLTPNTTRYYWYPGDKKEWLRALVACGAGGAVFGLTVLLTRSVVAATVLGVSTSVGCACFNLGRRDTRALDGLDTATITRREAVAASGRGAWRGMVEGVAVALAVLLVAYLPARGLLADWLLPLVPALAAGIARQGGLLSARLTHESAKASTLGPGFRNQIAQAARH
ncbi:hypothetical protein GCM10009827_076170 [Dactylosporangium maewongense]|uniref:Uncharacterized protein n=1 Tax=Dactylosporangium maewongense TaxID=634393 RepID=A0ABP4MIH1_9ACTN